MKIMFGFCSGTGKKQKTKGNLNKSEQVEPSAEKVGVNQS
jgi:hypothetical protein